MVMAITLQQVVNLTSGQIESYAKCIVAVARTVTFDGKRIAPQLKLSDNLTQLIKGELHIVRPC